MAIESEKFSDTKALQALDLGEAVPDAFGIFQWINHGLGQKHAVIGGFREDLMGIALRLLSTS